MTDITLHMFSGGRDSVLSAALMLEKGYCVKLATYNNGCICGVDNIKSVEFALVEKYKNISTHHVYENIDMTVNYLKQDIVNMDLQDLATDYPHINMNQLNCLYCKVAMFIHAIVHCKRHPIENISDGTRESQGFYVDSLPMYVRMKNLCSENGIMLHMPIFRLDSDLQRKCMLCDRGLPTKTLEIQCFSGIPMNQKLTVQQMDNLSSFYDKFILDKAKEYIKTMINSNFLDVKG